MGTGPHRSIEAQSEDFSFLCQEKELLFWLALQGAAGCHLATKRRKDASEQGQHRGRKGEGNQILVTKPQADSALTEASPSFPRA